MMRLSEQYQLVNRFRESAPVDVEALAEALGIEVHSAFLEQDISGMLERDKSDDQYRITINALDPQTRQRFTLAHELGHYMLHRHLIGDGVDDDRAYRSTAKGKYHNTAIGPRQETEANKFAANVLMPFELIKALKAKGIETPEDLARELGVSEHAMYIRLGRPYPARFQF